MAATVLGMGCGANGGVHLNGDAGPPEAASTGGSDAGEIVVRTDLVPRDECATDGDCADPSLACMALSQGGRRVCYARDPRSAPLTTNQGECAADRPCATGTCATTGVWPSSVCGLGGVSLSNSCGVDKCATDADCPGGVCGPPGLTATTFVTGGTWRACIPADCRSNADCAAHPGGTCAFMSVTCTAYMQPGGGLRFGCVYPGGCFDARDCGNSADLDCQVVAGARVCVRSTGP